MGENESTWSGLHSASTVAVSNTKSSYTSRTTNGRLSLDAMDALLLCQTQSDFFSESDSSYNKNENNNKKLEYAIETVRSSLILREGVCLESLLHYFNSPQQLPQENDESHNSNESNSYTHKTVALSSNSAQWDLESRANRYVTYAPFKLPKKSIVKKQHTSSSPLLIHSMNKASLSKRLPSIKDHSDNVDDTKSGKDSKKKRSVPVDVDDDVYVLNSDLERTRSQLRTVQENLNQFIESHKLAEATELLRRVQRTVVTNFGGDSPEEASALYNLGNVQLLYGQYEASIKSFERVVQIWENLLLKRSKDNDGKEKCHCHPFIAVCVVKAGIAKLALGNYKGALGNMCDATNIRKQINEHSVDIMKYFTEFKSINNIGVVMSFVGNREAAMIVFKKAMKKYEDALQHVEMDDTALLDVSILHCNIGFLHFQAKKYKKSNTQYRKAYELQRKILSADHPMITSTKQFIELTTKCFQLAISKSMSIDIYDEEPSKLDRAYNSVVQDQNKWL